MKLLSTPAAPVAPLLARPFLAALRDMVAGWDARSRFRWKLARMAADNPHLIDDIGLTEREVAMEIAKPFWRR